MLFTYSAKSKTGEIVEATLEAANRYALSKDLRSRGFTPLSITGKSEGFAGKFLKLSNIFSKVKIVEQIVLTKNLSGMIRAGLSLSRALSVLKKQTKNPKLDKILTSIANDINSGETFSAALSKFPDVFSKLFISMIRAGEESGNLAGALSDIGLNLEKSNSLNKKIKGALIYPGVIVSAMVIIGVLMFAFVVPTLANTFKELGVVLPVSTRIIIFLGNFFSNNLILTFVIILGMAFGFFSLFRAKFIAPFIYFFIINILHHIFGYLKRSSQRNTGK